MKMPATLKLITATPIATWKAYLTAHFLSSHAAYLPSDIDDAQFAFYGTVLGGQLKQRERWRRGISAVESQIGELLGEKARRRGEGDASDEVPALPVTQDDAKTDPTPQALEV